MILNSDTHEHLVPSVRVCRPYQVPGYNDVDILASRSVHLRHIRRQYVTGHQYEDTYNLYFHVSSTEVRVGQTIGSPLNLHVPEDRWQSKQRGILSLLKALIGRVLSVHSEGCLISCVVGVVID